MVVLCSRLKDQLTISVQVTYRQAHDASCMMVSNTCDLVIETIESLFYYYRATGDEYYKVW